MPRNSNPWVRALLNWHGYGIGGVRVPFRDAGRPSGHTIRTPVIDRLEELAKELAAGKDAPRWIFLVGGPGNGKSEAVEAFIVFLDEALDAKGEVVKLAKAKFTSTPGVSRRVELLASELGGASAPGFARTIGKLIVVQDASAMDTQGDSGQALVDDLAGFSLADSTSPTVYLCCVNRGVLASACRLAYAAGAGSRTFATLKAIIDATAFRLGTASGPRLSCWPLADSRVACWPLDVSSLLDLSGGTGPPGDLLLAEAAAVDKWETAGACSDCDARHLCPFRENARRLREPASRAALVKLVRRGELASGERLNFRSALSLVAEAVVGDWPDFSGLRDPCEWVHELSEEVEKEAPASATAIRASLRLMSRLTPHAIFRDRGSQALLELVQSSAVESGRTTTVSLISEAGRVLTSGNSSLLHSTLPQVLSPLDPGRCSPGEQTSVLRRVEDEYSQGVADGNGAFRGELTSIELQVLQSIEIAEAEWDSAAVPEAQEARRAQRWLRGWASCLVKRSIATRTCHHLHEEFLTEYEAGLREKAKLLAYIEEPLRSVVGRSTFRFGVMESFGRALQLDGSSLMLHSGSPGITLQPAPSVDPHAPAHDFPVLFMDEHGIPLTFEVFLALRLQGAGCTSSSLPPGVRAALDQVRHLRAGRACRDRGDLANGRAWLAVGELGRITLDPSGGTPIYTPGRR